MDIVSYINGISDNRLIGKGYEKKCYNFGNVVLLESRYLTKKNIDDEVENTAKVKSVLDSIDVNSYKIYDYKIYNDKFYILESKVFGDALQSIDFDNDISVYIDRLKVLDNIDILKKFVSDCFLILDNGLNIDFGMPSNFLFDGNKISFIDLGVGDNSIDRRYVCFYILHNLIFTYSDVNCDDDISKISFYIHSIYKKLVLVFKDLGYTEEMYSFSPNGDIMSFIDRKISRFKLNSNNKINSI